MADTGGLTEKPMKTSYLPLLCALPLTVLTATAQDPSTVPATELVRRISPQLADKIIFTIDTSLKSPVISGAGAQVKISAPDVLECIRGYGYYLRNVAGIHLSQNGDNSSASQFIVPSKPITVDAALPFNYAFNYCTLSYSCVHWDKARWEREIDFLALNGFKYMLVTSGLEKVWQEFLKELDYPADKIRAFIPAPTHAAWWNMGNLEGEGGPLSQTLIDSEAALGRFIVSRMKELGMKPVLQAYVGFLPDDFPKGGVNGKILPQGKWCGYNRPAVLQPTSEAFAGFAETWYKHLHKVYGSKAEAYAGDLFHEGGNKGDTPLTEAAQAVQKAMLQASPDSYWLIQAWGGNPDGRLVQGTDAKHTVILALNKNMAPGQSFRRNYQGRPYVWCELANFGGKHGMYGGFELLEQMPGDAEGAIGIGLLSEGVETNPLYYALFYERVNNRGSIDRTAFLANYARARYGRTDDGVEEALQLLASSVYAPDKQREGCVENIACARPSLNAAKASTWSSTEVYYSPEDLEKAAKLLLAFGKKYPDVAQRETYRYDLADVCRQVLSDRMRAQLSKCREAFESRNKRAFTAEKTTFLKLIRDTAELLATSEHFLLGRYLHGATGRGTTKQDKQLIIRSLKQLFTTWRPDIGVLNDYSHRQFSEMMSHYYYKRWNAFFDSRLRELSGKASDDESGETEKEYNTNNGEKTAYSKDKNAGVDSIELAFRDANTPLLRKPKGDTVKVAEKILKR